MATKRNTSTSSPATQATTSVIRATSRVSFKPSDAESTFYTVEYSEERTVPDNMSEEDIAKERARLWDDVNAEVDAQYTDVLELYRH